MVATEESRIQKLDESVVNKIAAGEIIVQPANALKELLENSIDANATMIDILVRDGGLKLLQITDNGGGIAKDDLGLLCERFATSKLTKFEDLESIATYGFRGEALASISHISRLSVITKSKTSESPLAFKAFYLNGRLVGPNFKGTSSDPKPIAGKDGTQIIVEDLFYNIPSRLKSIRNKSDEYMKILDVIGKYAVHTNGVGFSLKKFGEPNHALITRPNIPLKERIRIVYGSECANALINVDINGKEVDLETNDSGESYYEKYGLLQVTGAITNCNFNYRKKLQSIFFINHRLVSCDPLRRVVNSIYHFFLPKGYQPFIYLSLELKPDILDVNVHPTKREVRFLNEDEIIEIVSAKVHKLLSSVDNSRTFKSQVLLSNSTKREQEDYDSSSQKVKKYRQENKLVRIDSSQPKLNELLSNRNNGSRRESRNSQRPISIPETSLQSLSLSDKENEENPSNEEEVNNEDSEEKLLLEEYDESIWGAKPMESKDEPVVEEPLEELEAAQVVSEGSVDESDEAELDEAELDEVELEEDEGNDEAEESNEAESERAESEEASEAERDRAEVTTTPDINSKLSQLRKFNRNEPEPQREEESEPELELEVETGEEPDFSMIDITNDNETKNTSFELEEIQAEEIQSEDALIYTDKKRVKVTLDSIIELKDLVTTSTNQELTAIIRHGSYIGIVDVTRRLCCIQHEVNLYLCDYAAILYEFFYQIALSEFCNYGEIELDPLSLDELLDMIEDKELKTEEIISNIIQMKDMFEEYFQIKFIEEDNKYFITGLPMLVKNHDPSMNKLPYFIYRLGLQINYEEERGCLEGIMRQISLLYVPEIISSGDNEEREAMNVFLRDQMFPQLKTCFHAPTSLSKNITQIADLPGLYRIFERC